MAYELGRTASARTASRLERFRTAGHDGRSGDATFQIWNDCIPMGRLGHAQDIAAAVVFFCLPETEWTTGQTLLVDGGHISYLREE